MADNLLAILGGDKTVKSDPQDLFKWPICTPEHEQAVLEVYRQGSMSNIDITLEFEKQYAGQLGMKYAIACNNGTAAIHCGLYGLGVGAGDEVICPSITYWASIVQALSLGAVPVFADIKPDDLCVDPDDIERCITPRTKAIVVVHYAGMPADMDRIMSIAAKHNIKVLEDCSHAHASLYKGKEVGTFGDASGFSLMSGKSFAIGEAGILFTNDFRVYERAVLLGHYDRHVNITSEDLKACAGLPNGGYKYRIHQASSAFGLVQLKYYRQQFAEIDRAMNYFCDLLDGQDALVPIRPAKGSSNTKGGWYFPLAHYKPELLGGLSANRFSDAVQAEGGLCWAGCNLPLHKHPLFESVDVYGHGRPTVAVNRSYKASLSHIPKTLPISEKIVSRICVLPWFKKFYPELIQEHANAYKKVIRNHKYLLEGDKSEAQVGAYSSSFRRR